jgi:DNA-binding GntR family transcriptional regulator
MGKPISGGTGHSDDCFEVTRFGRAYLCHRFLPVVSCVPYKYQTSLKTDKSMTNRYLEVAAQLRHEIEAGHHGTDRQLATEAELGVRFAVSRATVRAALEHLRTQGFVTSRRGSGWYVNRAQSWPPLLIRIGASGRGSKASQLDAVGVSSRRRRPDRKTAALLGVSSAKALLVVERVSGLRGDPIHVATSWFGPAATAALDNHEAETTPPARLVAAKGFVIAEVEQYVEAVPADVGDAATFSIREGACLLQVMRIAHGDDGAVIFLSRHRHPGGRVQMRIDLPTTDQPDRGHVGFVRIDQN